MSFPLPTLPLIDGPTPPSQVSTMEHLFGVEEQQMIKLFWSLNVRPTSVLTDDKGKR